MKTMLVITLIVLVLLVLVDSAAPALAAPQNECVYITITHLDENGKLIKSIKCLWCDGRYISCWPIYPAY